MIVYQFIKFTKFLIYEIQKNGYVRITTESSNSRIPFEKNKSNEYIAYEHLNRSKELLNDYLKKHLIDPNRLIAAGRGEYNALADNATAEGRSTNRRTRIIILHKIDQFYDLLNPNAVPK